MMRRLCLYGLAAVGLAIALGFFTACERLTGTPATATACRGYTPTFDTLTVYIGASGRTDSVHTQWTSYVHLCGAPRTTPPRPTTDTVRTGQRRTP